MSDEVSNQSQLENAIFCGTPLLFVGVGQRRLRVGLSTTHRQGLDVVLLTLSIEEQNELTQLRTEFDRQLLQKAHAAALLQWRGHQIPPADKL